MPMGSPCPNCHCTPCQCFDYQIPPHPTFTPQGCICPPTAEQTCQNPTCPRKGPLGVQFAPRTPDEIASGD